MRNISDKFEKKIDTYILRSTTFPKIVPFTR